MIKGYPKRYIQGHSPSRKFALPWGMCICRDMNCTIPYGTCHCGCMALTEIAAQSHTTKGWIVGMPKKFREGHTKNTTTVIKRLMKYRIIDDTTGCWLWAAACDKDGYGLIKIKKVMHRVPSVSYETFVGQVPKGLQMRHRCDNPPCFNPNHLLTGTAKENRQDAFDRGRITAEMIREWVKKRKKKGNKEC